MNKDKETLRNEEKTKESNDFSVKEKILVGVLLLIILVIVILTLKVIFLDDKNIVEEEFNKLKKNNIISFAYEGEDMLSKDKKIYKAIKSKNVEAIVNTIAEEVFLGFKIEVNNNIYESAVITDGKDEKSVYVYLKNKSEKNGSLSVLIVNLDDENDNLLAGDIMLKTIMGLTHNIYLKDNPGEESGYIAGDFIKGEIKLLDKKDEKKVYAEYIVSIKDRFISIEGGRVNE